MLSGMSGTRFATDLSEDLILMWQAIQSGWDPPTSVSEPEYGYLKHAAPSPLRGFVGYGLSFAGKWFGGYARNNRGDDYCKQAKTSLLKIRESIRGVVFANCSYSLFDASVTDCLIYCDPPYLNTTKYRFGEFNHPAFWQWVRDRSRDNIVVVSEYTAPEDFECVLEINTTTDLRDTRGAMSPRTEKLFRLRK